MTRASSTMMPVRSRGPEDPSLDAFLAAVRDSNPFLANRVTEPSAYDVDVQGIHADAFNRLVKLAAQAHRDRSAIGAMLLGNAGIGKSHLLSRLYRWANQGDGGGPGHACYVYLLNILADPDRLARYLLKCVVSRLAEGGRGPLYETPLYRLVDGAIRHALGASSYTLKDGREAFRSRYADVVPMKDVGEVLFQFVRHARPDKASDPSRLYLASQAAAWLSGEEIDPGPAGSLGLRVDGQESIQLGDDQQVMHVLLSLTRLAHANGQPFVLCVDQVDILDADKLKALTRFLQALIDQAKNLLVITSGIKSTLLQFKQDDIIPDSSWDRIAQYTVELGRVRIDDARRILEARLERFHEPFMPLDRIRGQVLKDTLFPLGRAWLDRQLSDVVEFRPRDVLIWARDAWDDEQSKLTSQGGDRWLAEWPTTKPPGPKPIPHKPTQAEIESEIDATVGRKTEEHVAQRQLQPGSLPPDAGNLAGLVEALLGQCLGDGLPYTLRGVERKKKQKGVLPPYDLHVREHREDDSREVTTGVLFVTNIGLSATTALRRLLEDGSPPDHRILSPTTSAGP
ncbi:MAG: AAA family ATPase [Isosphaeraceae bacterium]